MHLFQLSFRNILITKGGVSKQMSAFMQANCRMEAVISGPQNGAAIRSIKNKWENIQPFQVLPKLVKGTEML